MTVLFKDIITTNIVETGNGFTFEAHTHWDFVQAVARALSVYSNRENYLKLRQNAYESVWDVLNVAEGWLKEFARLKRVMWANEESIRNYKKENLEEFEEKSLEVAKQQESHTK